MNGDVLTIVLHPPLGACHGAVGDGTERRGEDALVAAAEARVERGNDGVVVDLGGIGSATDDEVKSLTGFLWALRVAGARPAVACPAPDVLDVCRALKLDQAFPVRTDRAGAAASLASS